jgi:hypothetical protein
MTATVLKSAIATHERTVDWLIATDGAYADIVNMLALIGRLRDQLLSVQRGTFAVGSRGAR